MSTGLFNRSAASQALVNANIVMVINDEISFTDQAHLHVSVVCGILKLLKLT